MQRLCSNPRVGASRPVPNGTLTLPLSRGCRGAMALLFRLSQRRLGRQSQESLSRDRDSVAGGWNHSRQRWFQGHPSDASALVGKGAQ